MKAKIMLLMLASVVLAMGDNIPAMLPTKFTEAVTLKIIEGD